MRSHIVSLWQEMRRKKPWSVCGFIEGSNDGFYVAREDLKLRGPGDLFGIRQSGELFFKLADIYQDANELRQANEAAASYTQQDVSLLCKKYDGLRQKLQEYTGEVYL